MGNATSFTKYTSQNELLRQHKFNNQITKETVSLSFISELKVYKTVLPTLGQRNAFVQQSELSDVEQMDHIKALAKRFELVAPGSGNSDWQMKFEWTAIAKERGIANSTLDADSLA